MRCETNERKLSKVQLETMAILWLIIVMLTSHGVTSSKAPEEDAPKQKCVSGYCLPIGYQKLESPIEETATTVSIETDIMDFLMVAYYMGFKVLYNNNVESIAG